MREFAYHIFRVLKTTMDRISTGEAQPRTAGLNLPGRSYESFEKIAEYGAEVLAEYSLWAKEQDVEALRAAPSEGSTMRSGAEQLDQAGGHTTQHLRQLYFMLEKYGIEPENRLPDSELPPEYVLTILW